MKPWHVWVSIAAILAFGFLFSQDSWARLAWQKYRLPAVALWLTRDDAKLAAELGNYYFNRGAYDLEKAKLAYQKALRAEPGILWGHYQLGRIYFVQGDYGRALEEVNKELESNPYNLRSLYVRGLIYGYRRYPGDLEKAEDDFRRFTQWAPKEWAGYNDWAWILSTLGKYKEAKEAILKALREIPDAEKNPWIWNSLGVAELNLRQYQEAETSFEKAKNLSQNLTLKDWQRSYPGNDPGQAASGLEAFRKAIEENLRRASVGGRN